MQINSLTAIGTAAILALLAGCKHAHDDAAVQDDHDHEAAASAPTNRIDIPEAVRRNLGIVFARVESRPVARTLRIPGQFEYLPTARREYRAPMDGRVELLVKQFERVEAGTPLFRLDSAAWKDLHERIAALQAHADSFGPLREAHQVHERSLQEKVKLWEDRLKQLEQLRTAGGGNAAQFTEARATLNATQAELADTMEKDAQLVAEQKVAQAELRALVARRVQLIAGGGAAAEAIQGEVLPPFEVRAIAPGVIEAISITPGGLAQDNSLILSIVAPEQIRFRARALQSDLGVLRDGLAAAVVPPQSSGRGAPPSMSGVLRLGLAADAAERTIDLIVEPTPLASWARAGVAAHLEVTLEGTDAPQLAVPLTAVLRDGAVPVLFRRDPANPDKAIRLEADVGLSDGRWIVLESGVKEGDEVIIAGNYQLMLATSGTASKPGHFHSDGTFHDEEHK